MIMPSLLSVFLSANNLVVHTVFAISLTLLLSFLKIPALFLHGLHTYIHPDDVDPNASSSSGIRAAIRRPGAMDSEQPKPRKKSKDRFEFDETKAQIFRLKLNEGHLQSRIYFNEFYSAFNFTVIGFLSLLLHRHLMRVDEDSGVVKNGTIIPLLLGLAGVGRLFFLIFRVGIVKSASKRSERQLSFVCGVLAFVLGLAVVFEVVPNWILDFRFESLDGLGKFSLAAFMGCIVGCLYIPALRNSRAFWLGTDQIRSNLSIVSCGWFSRMLLYATYLMAFFTSMLWITPFAELLINNIGGSKGLRMSGKKREVMAGYVGMSRLSFDTLRTWSLFIMGLLQFLTVRPNAQMFLNEAVLCWYQRLHASKVPDLDYSRAKVFLHNHYLCLVVVQFFVPAMMLLLLVGLWQLDGTSLKGIPWVYTLVKEVSLFMAWWTVFIWTLLSSAILALYRHGTLYVS